MKLYWKVIDKAGDIFFLFYWSHLCCILVNAFLGKALVHTIYTHQSSFSKCLLNASTPSMGQRSRSHPPCHLPLFPGHKWSHVELNTFGCGWSMNMEEPLLLDTHTDTHTPVSGWSQTPTQTSWRLSCRKVTDVEQPDPTHPHVLFMMTFPVPLLHPQYTRRHAHIHTRMGWSNLCPLVVYAGVFTVTAVRILIQASVCSWAT